MKITKFVGTDEYQTASAQNEEKMKVSEDCPHVRAKVTVGPCGTKALTPWKHGQNKGDTKCQ